MAMSNALAASEKPGLLVPQKAERAGAPRVVPPFLGQRCGELAHHERGRNAPDERRRQQDRDRGAEPDLPRELLEPVRPTQTMKYSAPTSASSVMRRAGATGGALTLCPWQGLDQFNYLTQLSRGAVIGDHWSTTAEDIVVAKSNSVAPTRRSPMDRLGASKMTMKVAVW